MQLLCQTWAALSTQAPTLLHNSGIKPRIPLTWACYKRFKRELHVRHGGRSVHSEGAHDRMIIIEVAETLIYGCGTGSLGQERRENFAALRTAHHQLFLQIIGLQRRQRIHHLMSFVKALNKQQIRERRDDHPQAASSLRGSRTADEKRAANTPGDVRDGCWSGECGTRPIKK